MGFSSSFIADMYADGATQKEISLITGYSIPKILNVLIECGVPRRTPLETNKKFHNVESVSISTELTELIDGLLLGDGQIEYSGHGSYRLKVGQMTSHTGWLDMIQDLLSKCGVKSKIGPHIRWPDRSLRSSILRTPYHQELKPFYDRWYGHSTKKKIIPSDACLSPQAIAQWYCGDGGITGGGYQACFSTDCFSRESVMTTAIRLEELYDWKPYITGGKVAQIRLTRVHDRVSLVSMISPLMPPCFKYKLNLRTDYNGREVTIEDLPKFRSKIRRKGSDHKSKRLGNPMGLD